MKRVMLSVALAAGLTMSGQAQTQPGPGGAGPTPQAPESAPVKGLKTPPAAKTQEEYNTFNSALTSVQGPDLAAGEAAARGFQAKFPQSELTPQLYLSMLFKSLQENNGDKAIDMGREVLKLEPANPVAAVYVATVLAETTRETDLDASQKFDEAGQDAKVALQNVDANLMMAAGVTQQQADATKADLRARAYDALGLVELKRKNDAAAEKYLRQSVEIRGEPGDPMTHLRLALALDRENKYPEALAEARRSVALSQPDQSVAKSAQAEVDRLSKLTGSAGSASAPATAPAQAPPSQAVPPVPR